ncbi:MAG: hypothetical protein JNM69_35185 [Archangium sp.]|nr:hypothetical protein [Archangium sp.]
MTDASSFLQHVLVNLVAAPLFVAIVSRVPQPWMQRSMAVLLLGASTSYLTGGLGLAELPFAAAIASFAIDHAASMPLLSFWPLSSFGCAIFDPLIAIWFLLGAPTLRRPTWSLAS